MSAPAPPAVWTAKNPEYERLVRESFARQHMMASLGARLTHVAPGEIDIAMDNDARYDQQNGFMHAGAIASIGDSANGYAAFTLAAPGTDVLAVEFKINLLAPARAPRFVAEGRVLRPGRTITACRADVYGLEGDERVLVATMLSTIIVKEIRWPS
jgi:uncharacterized protein (TIGR00369 family)